MGLLTFYAVLRIFLGPVFRVNLKKGYKGDPIFTLKTGFLPAFTALFSHIIPFFIGVILFERIYPFILWSKIRNITQLVFRNCLILNKDYYIILSIGRIFSLQPINSTYSTGADYYAATVESKEKNRFFCVYQY
jgi:hypothetical protein